MIVHEDDADLLCSHAGSLLRAGWRAKGAAPGLAPWSDAGNPATPRAGVARPARHAGHTHPQEGRAGMDEDQTQRVDVPGEAAPPATDAPAPPPAPTEPSPSDLLPPPPPPPAAASAWQPAAVAPPGLDVGGLVGRTFDTFGREWSLYLTLALPAGLGAFASTALQPSIQAVVRDPGSPTGLEQIPGLLAQLLFAFVGVVASLAMIVATDGYWRGTPVGLGESVGRALTQLPRAIGLFLVALGIGLVAGLAIAALALVAFAAGPAGVVLVGLAILVCSPSWSTSAPGSRCCSPSWCWSRRACSGSSGARGR